MVIELRIYSRLIRIIKVRKQELNQKWFPSYVCEWVCLHLWLPLDDSHCDTATRFHRPTFRRPLSPTHFLPATSDSFISSSNVNHDAVSQNLHFVFPQLCLWSLEDSDDRYQICSYIWYGVCVLGTYPYRT